MTIAEGLMTLILLLYGSTVAINLITSSFSDSFLTVSVTDLYHETKMNCFGCALVWIGIVIINPFWWLVYKPLLYVAKFFKWLFTVGRK